MEVNAYAIVEKSGINNIKQDMENNNYNIGLLSDYTIKNFWKKIDHKHMSLDELKESYDKFYAENLQPINESVNELAKNAQLINEGAAELRKKRQGTKADVKPERKIKSVSIEDEIYDDEEDDEGGFNSIDDIEKRNANRRVIKKKTIYDEQDDYLSHDEIHVKNVKNGYKNGNVHDIHYAIDLMYYQMIHPAKGEEPEWDRTDTDLPCSLFDTKDVTEFDAVFAFKDLPNVDLSRWDVSNGVNFDGMFYKSTFNNDSVKYWELRSAENIRNMFVGSDMDKKDAIDAWEDTIKTGYLPDLGKTSSDESEKARKKLKAMSGKSEDIKRKMADWRKRRMENIMDNDMDVASRQYVLSSDEYINEKFGDTAKKIANKIKGFAITLKNGFKYFIDKGFEFFSANSPLNIVKFIKEKNVNGVYAENGKALNYPEKSGWYGLLKEGDVEYNNYFKFMDYLKSIKPANESLEVNERRVGLGAKDKENGQEYVNIGAPDIDSSELRDEIDVNLTEIFKKGKTTAEPMLVWGAPGIGKTTIPKTLIDEINKVIVKNGGTNEDKMSIIVVDCSILQAGDLMMPMPVKGQSVKDEIKNNPAAERVAKSMGLTLDDFEKMTIERSSDAPKTWLPMYKPTGDAKKDKVLNAIANGAVNPIYDDEGFIDGYEKTGGGGILMFDEFLRADPDTLFGIAQIMLGRSTTSGYVLGNKWWVMGCSNRPADDVQVANNWADAPDALKQRMSQVNFVPTFKDWCEWAKTKGGFDNFTLDFISMFSKDNAKSRWHNIDPTANMQNQETRSVSPRSWSRCVAELNRVCELRGCNTYIELGQKRFLRIVKKFLPDALAEEYVKEYIENSGNPDYRYSYINVVANPDLVADENANTKQIIGNWQAYMQQNYSNRKPVPAEDLRKLVKFYEDNFGDENGNLLAMLIAKAYKVFDMFSEENETTESNELWDEYSAKHPEYDMDNLYDTVG